MMKKTHFPIGYFGNKREEVERIYNIIKDDLEDIKFIVEPFCGTSAFSYYLSIKMPKKFTYILNDNNKFLIELYYTLKDETKTNEMIEKLNTINDNVKNKEDYDKIIMDENIINWVYKNKVYNIRPNLYPKNRAQSIDIFNNMKNTKIIDFLRNENIIICEKNGLDLYKQYSKNNKALIFLDPPYLLLNNEYYKLPSFEIYNYIVEYDIDKEKAKICLCLNKSIVTDLLFKKKNCHTYDKIYQTTKKKIQHIIITNKKIKYKE
jgi:hypothetical protein